MKIEPQPQAQAQPRFPTETVACIDLDNGSVEDGDRDVASPAPDAPQQQPTSAKKPTRQWAAWTRQEEECFFTALRQVGKNFEKITRRVQSKNKNQVRHYYYRLVRRMNKLLGPDLYLDAKNSKDTNSAMLRWWSLLEKYSCKASKLHLKPRRFKIFVEALEHQLLKDRKKSARKRPSQVENFSPTAASTISTPSKAPGHDSRTVKLVLVDSQNIQKLGSGKGSVKRNVNMGVNRNNNKGDSTTMKASRQRRKPGGASSAAYKKWEKAAIAGVSMVADAAEHLERAAAEKEVENDQGQGVIEPVDNALPPLTSFFQSPYGENNVQNSMKLKLQLFPIDDVTRRALETDKHNPYLELTLSTRKKISSVLEHLNRKWGSSRVASGELLLFPYNVQRENLAGHQRWSQDSVVSAADVYAVVGSPPMFRLSYGWFSNIELRPLASLTHLASCCNSGVDSANVETVRENVTDLTHPAEPSNHQSGILTDSYENQPTQADVDLALTPPLDNVANDTSTYTSVDSRYNFVQFSDTATKRPWQRKVAGNASIVKQPEDEPQANRRLSHSIALSVGDWADSLTNLSVGDLLAEALDDMDADNIELPVAESSQYLLQNPFSCDSFDAAIAAHISRHQNKMGMQSTMASHTSSIWDAEETCDAFLFRRNLAPCQEALGPSNVSSPGPSKDIIRSSSAISDGFLVGSAEIEEPIDNSDPEDPVEECLSDPHNLDDIAKDFGGLTDVYWPDSLGPLDLDSPTSKYHSEDLILSDSLGLSRLIASSLDAFQNCSFFGLDKKDPAASAADTGETASTDLKNVGDT